MDLDKRMKMYEKIETNDNFIPLLPVYARLDGRCFSTLTRKLSRPYDASFHRVMVDTTKYLVEKTNACIGYTQSDEISLVWYSDSVDSQIFFGGRKFKMISILASMATARLIINVAKSTTNIDLFNGPQPEFDCRVLQLPSLLEASNMILWREMDATKNAISMACRHYYSHNEMLNKNGIEMQEMLFRKGINFNDYPSFFKRGTFVQRKKVLKFLSEEELVKIPLKYWPTEPVERTVYEEIEMPPFSKVHNRVGVIFEGQEPISEE